MTILVGLKPLYADIRKVFSSNGFEIGPAMVPQFVYASLGFWSAETARGLNTPLIFAKNLTPHHPLPFEMHMCRLIDRIVRVLGVDEWTAQSLAVGVLRITRTSGLCVDTQKVFFDPVYDGCKNNILKAMYDDELPVTQATVAMAIDTLPALPTTSLPDRLAWVSSAQITNGSLAHAVRTVPTYLWESPTHEIDEITSAFLDKIYTRNGTMGSAELGLGICLLQEAHLPRTHRNSGVTQHRIITPVAFFSGQRKPGWYPSAHLVSRYSEYRGKRALTDYVGGAVTSLPRLRVCSVCLTIYSDDHNLLRHRCASRKVDARDVNVALKRFDDQGERACTTQGLLTMMRSLARNATDASTATCDELDAFLNTHALTLGIRRGVNGPWYRVGHMAPREAQASRFEEYDSSLTSDHAL